MWVGLVGGVPAHSRGLEQDGFPTKTSLRFFEWMKTPGSSSQLEVFGKGTSSKVRHHCQASCNGKDKNQ